MNGYELLNRIQFTLIGISLGMVIEAIINEINSFYAWIPMLLAIIIAFFNKKEKEQKQ